jgi:hypothetical protein
MNPRWSVYQFRATPGSVELQPTRQDRERKARMGSDELRSPIATGILARCRKQLEAESDLTMYFEEHERDDHAQLSDNGNQR